ncbi:MAG TPA: tetratricopeptide repeat protein [Thermoanaerobaculia bacterium]|nr:tetratricopeptide repeat protein [Thermoanaerobaculia bacterium]
MRFLRFRFAFAGLVLAVPLAAAPPPAIPSPDLSSLEPAVAQQIQQQENALEELYTRDPDPRELAGAWADLGTYFHAYKLTGPAEEAYRKAMELDPKDPRWPHLLGGLLQDAGRLDDAVTAYGKALELAPEDEPALVHLGEIHFLQAHREAGEAVLKKALAMAPEDAAANVLLGQAALERGDFREAADRLETALRGAPGANRLHYPLSRAYRGLGDTTKADEHLAKVGPVGVRAADPILDGVESLRTGERARLESGKRAYNAGRFAEAVEELQKALKARPESVEARINLAAALARQGNVDEAIAKLREAVELEPTNPTAQFNLGLLLAMTGPSSEAIDHLAAAVAARPQDAEAHRELARLLRDAGRYDEALKEYGHAVDQAPADDAARLGRAETLVRTGRYGQARNLLEEDLKALPQSGVLTQGLARLLAACPDLSVRNGARALELGLATWNAQPLPVHAETVALAWAELGRCEQAARWEQTAVDAAQKAGYPEQALGEMKKVVERFGRGGTCRP